MEVIAICNSCGSHLSSKHVRSKGFSEVRINTDYLVHFLRIFSQLWIELI